LLSAGIRSYVPVAKLQLLNMGEAAEYLHTPKRTLQGHYQRWGIPHYKVGRNILFREDELAKWFEQQRRAA